MGRQGVLNGILSSGKELHRVTDIKYATCGRVVEEALEMQDENGRQSFDGDLLARLA